MLDLLGKMAGANIFSHFEIPKNADGNFKAKCIHCAVFISGNLKVTSNFVNHMKVI